ncbi:MAG: P-loop NTPase [Acidimicrobiaceae bacterium]|nr:P-loop NTPase [Acidimicrobiaceae bacterium]
MTTTAPTAEAVMDLMRGVVDPELGSNLVELGMARGAQVSDDGQVRIEIALTTAGCPLRAQIQRDVKARLESLPGVTKVRIAWAELTADEKAAAMAKARFNVAQRAPDTAIPPTTKVLMVASGKGGVGKSTVTTNLAAALAAQGFKVGVMDADIWGYSVPRMLGVDGDLRSLDGKIVPLTRTVGEGRLDVVSMGFLVDREDSALMWRGLMLNRAVQHFCEDVRWNDDLDYLLIDMPPGTGDVQMGLARMLPRAEMIIVTTPATAAQKVAARVVDMGRKNYLRIVGVIENMSYLATGDGGHHAVFGSGGGEALAAEAGVPLLGRIPLEAAVADGFDTGEPAVLGDGPAAEAFKSAAQALSSEHVPPVEMAGCSARMLEAAAAALDALDAAEA